MSKKCVTLEGFMIGLRQEVEGFEAMWRKEHARDAKNWPLTQQTTEDWQDQCIAWQESKEEEP